MSKTTICQICKLQFSARGLGTHILQKHNISLADYYNTYLRQNNIEGFCKVCGKATSFKGWQYGYNTYCSSKCSNNDPEIKQRISNSIKQHFLETYGVENSFQLESTKQKIKNTNLERYGAENPFQSQVIKDRMVEKHLEKYGVKYPTQRAEVLEKQKRTNLLTYGYEHQFQRPDVREKTAQSAYADESKLKQQQTNLIRYGYKTPLQRPDVIKKGHSKETIIKVSNTKRKNNTFNSSIIEEKFADWLIENNISFKRQYKDEHYPYCCDFYFPDKKLYVELNIFWTHEKHWFDKNSIQDQNTLRRLTIKSQQSKFYVNAISVWTNSDLEKRDIAIANNLNYVVLWTHEQINQFKHDYMTNKNFIGFIDYNDVYFTSKI